MSKTILIIEDDTYTRDIYEETLKDGGYSVMTAQDGQEGIQKASQGGFDLILLDGMMPKIDGMGVLKALKQNPPKLKNGPIIFLTNLAEKAVIEEALSLGASSYLVKVDIEPDQLVDTVKKIIKS